jgi:endonuclease-3
VTGKRPEAARREPKASGDRGAGEEHRKPALRRPTRRPEAARSEPKASGDRGAGEEHRKPALRRPTRRADKAARIAEILDGLYPEPAIPLRHDDPFTLLVSVVLSAQCTDARVNQVTPALFARAPGPEAFAQLPVRSLERLIRSCGLAPQKARNLSALAKRLVAEHGGRVPAELDALEALPGVGHKTASVVQVQAFGVPAFPVDTHIHRLAGRWGLSSGRSVAQTERDLKRLFPERSWGRVHLQMIYFGREHCPALRHDPRACPICSWAAPKARIDAESRRRRRGKGTASRSAVRARRSFRRDPSSGSSSPSPRRRAP